MVSISIEKIPKFPLPSLLCPTHILRQSQSQNSTRVILVRHGRSTYNEQRRYQGCSDRSVLTEKGQKDAYQTGIVLQSIDIDVIYASPLQRVQQTAREILHAKSKFSDNLPLLFTTDKLKEINMSVWQGLSYQDVQENFPQEYYCWKNSPHQFNLINQEKKQETFPVIDLYEQVEQFWQEILPQHRGKTILIVSHGGTNRALINTALGIKPANYHCLQQSNCGISILEFSQQKNSRPCLKALNLTSHLGRTLPKLKEGKQGLRLLCISDDTPDSQLLQLAKFWRQELIDFILSNNSKSASPFTQSLCHNRSNFLALQVPKNNVLEVWQQQILSGKIMSALGRDKSLVTGLVIIDRASLNQILAEIPGSYVQTFANSSLNIIHYHHLEKQPVFQAIVTSSAPVSSKTRKVCLNG